METQRGRWVKPLIVAWTAAICLFLYMPVAAGALASLSQSRYFTFPIAKWSTIWWGKTFASIQIRELIETSVTIALAVTLISVALAFFGALAFARYRWRGRSAFQKLILLPIFFPQSVLGLALLLWFNALGLALSWQTAVFAHLVWIVPVATLVLRDLDRHRRSEEVARMTDRAIIWLFAVVVVDLLLFLALAAFLGRSLRDAASHLPFGEERVDDRAGIVSRGELAHVQAAGLALDLDGTFGPEVRFSSAKPGDPANRPPSDGHQFFGFARIASRTKVMTVELRNLAGETIYTVDLEAEA